MDRCACHSRCAPPLPRSSVTLEVYCSTPSAHLPLAPKRGPLFLSHTKAPPASSGSGPTGQVSREIRVAGYQTCCPEAEQTK